MEVRFKNRDYILRADNVLVGQRFAVTNGRVMNVSPAVYYLMTDDMESKAIIFEQITVLTLKQYMRYVSDLIDRTISD